MTRSLVEEAIQEHWGERCPDFEPGCPCCRAWAEYDKLHEGKAICIGNCMNRNARAYYPIMLNKKPARRPT